MKRSNLLLSIFVVGLISLGFAHGPLVHIDSKKGQNSAESKEMANGKYICPMHREITSEKPGKCPTCGMDLVQKKIRQPSELKDAYTCPMHPKVTSDKPGKCAKCGMSLVASVDPESKLTKARGLLDEAKSELAREGNYDCCVEDPCDECALSHESCHCANNLKAGKEVCSQCYGDWQRGEGAVNGVNARDVKMGHGHKH